jgi:hypothetical protein
MSMLRPSTPKLHFKDKGLSTDETENKRGFNMSTLTPLDSKTHSLHSIKPTSDFSFTKNDNLCTVLLAELNNLVGQSPIVFAKNKTADYELCSLQGLEADKNYCVSQSGLWKVNYIPARYRAYPFVMATETKSKKKILCFHSETQLISDTTSSNGIRLFDDDSKPSEQTKKILSFLDSLEKNQKVTNIALSAIVEAELLEDWEIKVTNGGKEEVLTGMKKVNFNKFSSIDDKTLALLKNSGSLDIIYAHHFSLQTLQKLGELSKETEQTSYTSHKDRAIAKKTVEDKKEVDNLVQNLLLDD